MSEFNTHGGFFSPYGYSKITEGGTHEQNPNGGVQFGTDQNGIPNYLEEGESVYKDYVFSNRIKLSAQAAKDNNIPEKYVGMKYSDIADIFVDEAIERPNDPISNNGVKAMLNRLIAAQEQQKAEQEERELQREIENLSPEELEQLNAMVGEQEEQPMMEQEVPIEQMPQEMPVEQPAMFAQGGYTEDDDPPGPDEVYAVRDNTATPFVAERGYIANVPTEEELAANLAARQARQEEVDRLFNGPDNVNQGLGVVDLIGGKGLIATTKATTRISKTANKISKGLKSGLKSVASKTGKAAKSVGESAKTAKEGASTARNTMEYADDVMRQTKEEIVDKTKRAMSAKPKNIRTGLEDKAAAKATELGEQRLEKLRAAGSLIGQGVSYGAQKAAQGVLTGVSQGAEALSKARLPKWAWAVPAAGVAGGAAWGISALSKEKPEEADDSFLDDLNKKAMGGNIYLRGTDGLDASNGYSYYTNPDGTVGYVYYPTAAGTTQQSAAAPAVKANTLLQATPAFGVQAHYTRKPLGVWSQNTPGMWANNIWTGYVNGDSGSTKTEERASSGSGYRGASTRGAAVAAAPVVRPGHTWGPLSSTPTIATIPTARTYNDVVASHVNNELGKDKTILYPDREVAEADAGNNYPLYNTGLRYAGAVGSAIGALYNSARKPTRFTLPDVDVVVPTGSIRQQYQKYQSIDPALYQNALAAQTNAQRRALMNSGLGPSVTPTLTALDSNATGAMGSAAINGIADANNRRNAVITANNGADAKKAAFDYQVMAARAQAINQAKSLRSRYDILVQQLNDAATTEQYQAISKELDAVKQALSAIGRENFVLNQVNTNEALRYGANPGGIAYYKTLLKNYGE